MVSDRSVVYTKCVATCRVVIKDSDIKSCVHYSVHKNIYSLEGNPPNLRCKPPHEITPATLLEVGLPGDTMIKVF